MVIDGDHQQLGQVEVVRDEGAQQRAHETHGNRHEKPAARTSADGATDTAADARDNQ